MDLLQLYIVSVFPYSSSTVRENIGVGYAIGPFVLLCRLLDIWDSPSSYTVIYSLPRYVSWGKNDYSDEW